jgi:hypothetical protein
MNTKILSSKSCTKKKTTQKNIKNLMILDKNLTYSNHILWGLIWIEFDYKSIYFFL